MTLNTWHLQHTSSRSLSKRIAARISAFVGSMTFIYIHVAWFSLWILVPVEPFPFGLLTMIVSLEAIFLSTFVMINANDAQDRDRAQAEDDYQTNISAKKEIEELATHLARIETEKLDTIIEIIKGEKYSRLKESNDLLRSVFQITKRKGEKTNWSAIEKRINRELLIQHSILFPKNK